MEAEAHDAWQKAALEPPRAYGETPVSGAVRVEHADFVVEERLGFEADGGEAHRLLLVEKVGTNTLFVARALAARPSAVTKIASRPAACGAKNRTTSPS